MVSWELATLYLATGVMVGFIAVRTPNPMYRDRCDEHDRCVYDPACPFFGDCELTDYTQ